MCGSIWPRRVEQNGNVCNSLLVTDACFQHIPSKNQHSDDIKGRVSCKNHSSTVFVALNMFLRWYWFHPEQQKCFMWQNRWNMSTSKSPFLMHCMLHPFVGAASRDVIEGTFMHGPVCTHTKTRGLKTVKSSYPARTIWNPAKPLVFWSSCNPAPPLKVHRKGIVAILDQLLYYPCYLLFFFWRWYGCRKGDGRVAKTVKLSLKAHGKEAV